MAFNIIHSKNQWHYNNNLWSKSGPLWEWRRCWNTEQALTDLSVNLGHPGYLLTRTHIFPHTSPLSLTSDVPYYTASQPLLSTRQTSSGPLLFPQIVPPRTAHVEVTQGAWRCRGRRDDMRPVFWLLGEDAFAFPQAIIQKSQWSFSWELCLNIFLKKLSPFPSPLPCFIIFSPLTLITN